MVESSVGLRGKCDFGRCNPGRRRSAVYGGAAYPKRFESHHNAADAMGHSQRSCSRTVATGGVSRWISQCAYNCANAFSQVLQYYLHRYGLHSPNSPLTKYHEPWYHSLQAPYSLAAHYDHPLAVLLTRFLPTYLPAILFRFHLLTYYLYLALISIEETFAYSGYSVLPTNFILGGMARRADAHLLSAGKGNFSAYGIMDWICGTTVGPELLDDVEGEVEEHDVRGTPRTALDRANAKGRGVSRRPKK